MLDTPYWARPIRLIFMDTTYGRRWILRIGNYEYAFSCEDMALIRRISFPGYDVLLLLIKDVLETLVVGVYDALCPVQAVSSDLKGKYNCTQFQIVGGVVLLVNLQLSRGICYHLTPLH
ncbi:hypothetical protein Tco_0878591 [Tanacetum coccineum]|uniref:Uncharacterized protein n=1 Tax=Tanacetum coccineum TaxID=301880 RepID=A0ABQ5BYB9_9ASTR